jgi:hypothetical protein
VFLGWVVLGRVVLFLRLVFLPRVGFFLRMDEVYHSYNSRATDRRRRDILNSTNDGSDYPQNRDREGAARQRRLVPKSCGCGPVQLTYILAPRPSGRGSAGASEIHAQSAIRKPHSAFRNPQSAIRNPQSNNPSHRLTDQRQLFHQIRKLFRE